MKIISNGGVPALTDNGTQVVSTEPIVAPAGSTAANSYQLVGLGATYGIHQSSGSYVFSANNADIMSVNANAPVGLNISAAATAGVTQVSVNGANWTQAQTSELLTLAAAATTDTAGNLLPANSIIEAVVVRVVTVIPTAATFTVGDATTAARFASGVAVAATTTAVGLTHVDQTGAAGPKQTAAAKIRITPNLTPGTATGQVRITVFYRQFVAPTS